MFMLIYRGTNRGSLITGHSVHNQMIKRVCIDVFAGCTNEYYELSRRCWIIRYRTNVLLCLPRCNTDLQQFCHRWNNHPMWIEHNCTLIQLYTQCLLTYHSSGRTNDIFNLRDTHAIDEGHITENDDSMVTVPPTLSPLTESLTSQLRQLIDTLSESPDGWVTF